MKLLDRNKDRETQYRHLMGITICLSLIISILLFRYLPDFAGSEIRVFQDVFTFEEVTVDEVAITRQGEVVPPPPQPNRPPVPVPDDIIVTDEFDFEELEIDFEPIEFGFEADDDDLRFVENPQIPPNVSRIVEPVVPEEFRATGVRAQIVITFMVNQEGGVEEVSINELRIFNPETNTYEAVPFIGYGIEEATIRAAFRWRFRPAIHQGDRVSTITRHVFSFGG